ncbi:MAG: hypothetical protein ABW221_16335 [Vicinamibacteria bacterium]
MIAYAPALLEGRLLGPGDGAAFHFPDKVAVWSAYRQGVLPSWNPAVLIGTPLLAAYHPGAFFPTTAAVTALPPFAAFQAMVLLALAGAGPLLYAYVRQLGADRVGAYFSGLSFALGPYYVGHLGDTPTLLAAPVLPLLLIAVEAALRRASAARAAGVAAAWALLLLAGSPIAVRAGLVLLAGRLAVALVAPGGRGRAGAGRILAALGAGLLLAAPQLVPTLLLLREAGTPATGLAASADGVLPGVTGLVLRYASHTPAPMLALAALLAFPRETPVRVLGGALLLALGLQWGRGPLAAPGSLPLVFELTLCVLAGLSLSAQWEARREARGRRLRGYLLLACLAAAAALSVAAAALGPLPQTLAGATGVLALSIIIYLPNATDADPIKAGVFLLPLTAAFLLQPYGRRVWKDAPTAQELREGSGTRAALDRTMGASRDQPALALVEEWPRALAADLAYANLAGPLGRRSVNGYEPLAPQRTLDALGAMRPGGLLRREFFATPPETIEGLGVRWVQVPAFALVQPVGTRWEVGRPLLPGRRRLFPFPIASATEVRVIASLPESSEVAAGTALATVQVRLAATGRELSFPLVAGPVSHRPEAATFLLPGRYFIDAVAVEPQDGAPPVLLAGVSITDAFDGRTLDASNAAAYVSDTGRFREAAVTPSIRLFEVPASDSRARVVRKARVLADEAAVLATLRGQAAPVDPRLEAVFAARDVLGVSFPADAAASVANVFRGEPGRIEVRAEGPGVLVVAETWARGWSAAADGAAVPLLRVNHAQMGLVLGPGLHRVVLRYAVPGLAAGVALSALAAAALLWLVLRERRRAQAAVRG